MPAPSVLPGRAFQNTARKSNLLFHFRSSDLLLKTVGGLSATFSRTSAAGRVMQKGLRRTDIATDADLIRLSDDGCAQTPSWGYWLNRATGLYEPALVVGRAYTNLNSSDDINGAWTDVGTPVITTGVSDPTGGTGAYRIADDNAGAAEGKWRTVTFTGNGTKSVAFVVRQATMPAAGVQTLGLWDDIAGVFRLALDISAWSSGEPTVAASAGTYLGKRYAGNGYWWLFGQALSVDAAQTNNLIVYPAFTAANTGSIDVYRANAFNDAIPPAFILAASVARTRDVLSFPFLAKPQVMTVYARFLANPSITLATSLRELFCIGGWSAGDSKAVLGFYLNAAGTRWIGEYDNGTGDQSIQWTQTGSPDDLIELCLTLTNGSATGSVTVNGGTSAAPVSNSISKALPAAWYTQTVVFGAADPSGTRESEFVVFDFKVAAGSWSLAQMREAF